MEGTKQNQQGKKTTRKEEEEKEKEEEEEESQQEAPLTHSIVDVMMLESFWYK